MPRPTKAEPVRNVDQTISLHLPPQTFRKNQTSTSVLPSDEGWDALAAESEANSQNDSSCGLDAQILCPNGSQFHCLDKLTISRSRSHSWSLTSRGVAGMLPKPFPPPTVKARRARQQHQSAQNSARCLTHSKAARSDSSAHKR